jgi:hypothetical protein
MYASHIVCVILVRNKYVYNKMYLGVYTHTHVHIHSLLTGSCTTLIKKKYIYMRVERGLFRYKIIYLRKPVHECNSERHAHKALTTHVHINIW